MLFVYGRAKNGDADWIEIGTTPGGRTLGWIPAAEAIDWKQTMVVLFTNPVNRDRALFFKESDPLLTLMESPDAAARAATLRQAAETRALPADSPVTAIEPPTWIDPAKTFYLLPILNWTDGYFASGFSGLALQVAATSLQEKPDQPEPAKPDPEEAAKLLEGYRAGVVFVVDTTISMEPYVARTRATIEALTAKLAASEEGDRVSFGLIGFRDVMPDGSPDGYITKVFATLADGHDRASLLGRLDTASASTADNLDFREDALAGVKSALDDIDWTGVAGRFVVLVTDASPRRANDPYSATHLDPDQLRLLAQSKGAALMVIHLKTPAGKADHDGRRGRLHADDRLSEHRQPVFPGRGRRRPDLRRGDRPDLGDDPPADGYGPPGRGCGRAARGGIPGQAGSRGERERLRPRRARRPRHATRLSRPDGGEAAAPPVLGLGLRP